MRAEHAVTLVSKDGKDVRCTIKKSTMELNYEVQQLAIEQQMLMERRGALWLGTQKINAELALAEVALEHAPAKEKKEATQRVEDANGAFKAVREKIRKYDLEISEFGAKQLAAVVNVSKGDAEKAPEIDWHAQDSEVAQEAIHFFSTGKLDSKTSAAS